MGSRRHSRPADVHDRPTVSAATCSGLSANATVGTAAPFAVEVDIIEAGFSLEMAIHARDPQAMTDGIAAAARWVRWAQGYWEQDGMVAQAQQCACVADQLEAWAATPPGDPAFQHTTLYRFQGELAALRGEAANMAAGPDVVRGWAITVLLVTVFVAQTIRSQQAELGTLPPRR